MQARGPLMIEHRLIERLLARVRQEVRHMEATGRVDPLFIDTVVDFVRVYADRTHHGKEEDILFRQLAAREMSEEDQKVMAELVSEHAFGRQTTRELIEANERYRQGDQAALAVIADRLKVLAEFYPLHIAKEDKVFFPAARRYFSDQEDQALLQAFWEFDRQMIHEKYGAVVRELEGPRPGTT
jgi:hemerythrin-like domain-containing protein